MLACLMVDIRSRSLQGDSVVVILVAEHDALTVIEESKDLKRLSSRKLMQKM